MAESSYLPTMSEITRIGATPFRRMPGYNKNLGHGGGLVIGASNPPEDLATGRYAAPLVVDESRSKFLLQERHANFDYASYMDNLEGKEYENI